MERGIGDSEFIRELEAFESEMAKRDILYL
jgi:hypothetical protein